MGAQTATDLMAAPGLEWVVRTEAPAGWPEALLVCGGGFFHTPAGLLAGAPSGELFYLDMWRGNELVGIAAGVRHGCRFSKRTQHVYFPTLPAVRSPHLREAALMTMCDAMRAEGADEIVVDSFDAAWQPDAVAGATLTAPRMEFVARIEPSRDVVPATFGANHRRNCTRGMRAGWTTRAAHGSEAVALLTEVQHSASERATSRGDGFEPATRGEAFTASCVDDPWGATVFAAYEGDALLAALAIGWANRRTFYVSGGSTPHGYASGAAAWLHWRVMRVFADRGFTDYNLGGTPARARDDNDPANGLRRFKTGFDAHEVPLHGLRWEFDSSHVRAHQVKRWVSRRYEAWRR